MHCHPRPPDLQQQAVPLARPAGVAFAGFDDVFRDS